MAYRLIELHVAVGDDSSLQAVEFNRSTTLTQVNDLITASPTMKILPGASQAQVLLGSLVQGYSCWVFSDYPVLVRFNGASSTQFQTTSNGIPATNIGAPLPPACVIGGGFLMSSLYIAPIANAAQTATCWIVATGDPQSAYV
jgi:hypothetical protein